MKRKVFYTIYIVSIMLSLLLLFVFMFFRDETIEADRTEVNADYDLAGEFDDYISRNFAFRTEAISLFTSLKANIFGSAAIDDVIIGNEGYLYYKDTVDDYSGLNRFTDRELYNAKKTIELMSEYVQSQGGKFLLVIAPNKNSLYDYMPYNYVKCQDRSNAKRLLDALDGVNYVDLFQLFGEREDELYFKTDTHWNDEGAYYVYEAMQKELGASYTDFLQSGYTEEKTLVGDLSNMLYPDSEPTEYKYKFQQANRFKFLTRTRSYEQAYIETYNEQGKNSLLMFRDSFANNLIEYLSNTYEYGIYDKNLPYDMTLMSKYDGNVVVASIAERNVKEYLEMAPIMPAPSREMLTGIETVDLCDNVKSEKSQYIKVSGSVNANYTSVDTDIYIKIDNRMFELTPVSCGGCEYGFEGYVENIDEGAVVSIVVRSSDNIYEQLVYLEFTE